ncbi:MAG TPA: hypothetical protein VGE36_10355 [Roseateles sp.]
MLARYVRRAVLVGIATLSLCAASTANEEPRVVPTLRILMLSNLPEVVTYQDQGFADFMRETKHVPVTTIEVASIVQAGLEAGLNAASKGYKVSVESADTRSKAEREQALSADAVKAWAQVTLQRPDVDAVVVVDQGTTRFERYVKGISHVTKIGLLGIEKLTMVFTMPAISIYVATSEEPCASSSPVRRTRIPAIYSKWADDMANGPSAAVHTQAQTLISQELFLAIKEALERGGARVGACMEKGRTARVP